MIKEENPIFAIVHELEKISNLLERLVYPPGTATQEPFPKKPDLPPDPHPEPDPKPEQAPPPPDLAQQFRMSILGQYSHPKTGEWAEQYCTELAEKIGKPTDYVYDAALKQWSGFMKNFERWLKSEIEKPPAESEPEPAEPEPDEPEADEPPQTEEKPPDRPPSDLKGLVPSEYDTWRNLKSRERFKLFAEFYQPFFEDPKNNELYHQLRQKWGRLLPEQNFPYMQKLEDAPADNPGDDLLLGVFPPNRSGDIDGSLRLDILRAIIRAEMLWPDFSKQAQDMTGISKASVQSMRDNDESYGAAYEYLSAIIDLGKKAGRDAGVLVKK